MHFFRVPFEGSFFEYYSLDKSGIVNIHFPIGPPTFALSGFNNFISEFIIHPYFAERNIYCIVAPENLYLIVLVIMHFSMQVSNIIGYLLFIPCRIKCRNLRIGILKHIRQCILFAHRVV